MKSASNETASHETALIAPPSQSESLEQIEQDSLFGDDDNFDHELNQHDTSTVRPSAQIPELGDSVVDDLINNNLLKVI